jgi:hypothetical protein
MDFCPLVSGRKNTIFPLCYPIGFKKTYLCRRRPTRAPSSDRDTLSAASFFLLSPPNPPCWLSFSPPCLACPRRAPAPATPRPNAPPVRDGLPTPPQSTTHCINSKKMSICLSRTRTRSRRYFFLYYISLFILGW